MARNAVAWRATSALFWCTIGFVQSGFPDPKGCESLMAKFVFSSDHLPAHLRGHQRAGVWAESLQEIGASFEFEIARCDHFRGQTEILPLGVMHLGLAMTNSPASVRVYRPKPLIAKDDDDRVQVFVNAGRNPMCARQFGREVVLGHGGMTVVTMGEPSEIYSPASGRTVAVVLPRSLVLGSGASLEDMAARELGTGTEARRLLVGHAMNLLESTAPLDPRVAALAGGYLAGLIRLLIGGTREVRAEAGMRAVPAARLAAIRAVMRRRFREPGFDAAGAGAVLGLSGRYVQHLFQQDGSTFSGELSALQLDAAHAELVAAQLGTSTIADIAFGCGFSDLSTFYRAFRARFGQTPNALRGSRAGDRG